MNDTKNTAATANDVSLLLSDCELWAKSATELARKYFRQPQEITFKSDESPVTVIDRLIESELKQLITDKYPDDAIFGEESGLDGDLEGNLWVIDPIDGTRSFISGNPLFGMLLSHLKAGVPVAGLISMPILGEIYTGGLGCGARCNGDAIRVSTQTILGDAVLYINEGEKLLTQHPLTLNRLLQAGSTRRFGYDCYPHALVASGHIDAVIDFDLQPYDYLALSSVIHAAGGIMTDWRGKALDLHSDGAVVSAATPELHLALLALLDC